MILHWETLQEIPCSKSKEEEFCSCLHNWLRRECRRQLSVGSFGLQSREAALGWRPLVHLEDRIQAGQHRDGGISQITKDIQQTGKDNNEHIRQDKTILKETLFSCQGSETSSKSPRLSLQSKGSLPFFRNGKETLGSLCRLSSLSGNNCSQSLTPTFSHDPFWTSQLYLEPFSGVTLNSGCYQEEAQIGTEPCLHLFIFIYIYHIQKLSSSISSR